MNKNEKLINRIQNLLAKTVENGATPEEAKTAYAKARELMANYKIDESDVIETKDDIVSKMMDNINTYVKWKNLLVRTFCKYHKVICYYNRPCKKIEYPVLFGHEVDVNAVVALINSAYKYVDKISDKYAVDYRNMFGSAKNIKPAYIIGFIEGLKSKYEAQNKTNEKFALMCITDSDVEEAYKKECERLNMKTSTQKNKDMQLNSFAFNAGFIEGCKFGTTPLPQSV